MQASVSLYGVHYKMHGSQLLIGSEASPAPIVRGEVIGVMGDDAHVPCTMQLPLCDGITATYSELPCTLLYSCSKLLPVQGISSSVTFETDQIKSTF